MVHGGAGVTMLATRSDEGCRSRLTSTVTTSIPAGFQRLRFQPSTHIAPRLRRFTVPSPSPMRTPLTTRGNSRSSVYSASIWERRRRGRSSGARGVVQSVMLAHCASTLSGWTSSCSYPSRVYLSYG